ncbi:Glutamate receptor 2.8 [Morella rubra]|uniref:Glutamate receptor 2.8 n=1 Tax=Morella rubra TaxID=262757 RepID=A0A6A1UXP0_9ROSI|nr:Glutamate receptor 2.8 [Morella rubra]
MKTLPYAVRYEFIPFDQMPDDHTSATYNDLVQQILLGVFPKGSPLVNDVSRAILNVTEGEKIKEIESAWFEKETNKCPASNALLSNNLGLASFLGLFVIDGAASLAALIFSLSRFLYKERVLTEFDSIDRFHPAGEKLLQERNNMRYERNPPN